MADRGRGAIINIASTAAFQPIPFTANYAATKAFVLSLSEATHNELSGKGVTVTAVCPGPVKTEFAEQAGLGEPTTSCPASSGPTSSRWPARPSREPRRAAASSCPASSTAPAAIMGQHTPRSVVLPLAKRAWRAAE